MSIRNRLFKHIGPKTRLSQGVVCMARTPEGKLLVGAGDGSISVMHPETLQARERERESPRHVHVRERRQSEEMMERGIDCCMDGVIGKDTLSSLTLSTSLSPNPLSLLCHTHSCSPHPILCRSSRRLSAP